MPVSPPISVTQSTAPSASTGTATDASAWQNALANTSDNTAASTNANTNANTVPAPAKSTSAPHDLTTRKASADPTPSALAEDSTSAQHTGTPEASVLLSATTPSKHTRQEKQTLLPATPVGLAVPLQPVPEKLSATSNAKAPSDTGQTTTSTEPGQAAAVGNSLVPAASATQTITGAGVSTPHSTSAATPSTNDVKPASTAANAAPAIPAPEHNLPSTQAVVSAQRGSTPSITPSRATTTAGTAAATAATAATTAATEAPVAKGPVVSTSTAQAVSLRTAQLADAGTVLRSGKEDKANAQQLPPFGGTGASTAIIPTVNASSVPATTGTNAISANTGTSATALAATVTALHQSGQTSTVLRLDPPGLGHLSVQVNLSMQGQVNVLFVPSSADAAQAIQASLPGLGGAMAQSGLTLGQAQVGGQFSQQSGQNGQNGYTPPRQNQAATFSADASSTPSGISAYA